MDEELAFDSTLATRRLLEAAQEQSLDALLKKIVTWVLEREAVARVRVWLIEKGDLCGSCVRRAECRDQTRCLHAVIGGSNLLSGGQEEEEYAQLRDRFSRIPFGCGAVGKIWETRSQLILRDLDKDPGELTHVEWLQREKIRAFNGVPIIFKGEILGVIAVFSRQNVPEEAALWGRIFAAQIAGAVANARAFEEIQRLKAQLEEQNSYLKEEVIEAKAFGNLVGQSAALSQIISQIDLVAPTDASVLILGETGTGKELVAHEIHRRSRRKDKPLIRVNCASIPKDLFESEFFGHTRGAFTGAVKDRAGRFETAEGGTLFLDEIGEVPMELQGKLLRVLQEKRYERVGDDRTRVADVRIVGATNRDLKKEAAAGKFREDLYYRLSVFPIQVAPLRDRREDIPLLAKNFVAVSVKTLGCPPPRLTRAGVVQLTNYDWPGNIRELKNVIERAVILARGGPLEFDLPTKQFGIPKSLNANPTPESIEPGAFFTEAEMQLRERENLARALARANGKIKGPGGAAELLGIKPTTLLSRIKKMGLERSSQQ